MATLLEKCNNIKNDKELNLKPENLKAGVTCLGVTGTLEELDTSNATATASDIADGKTAYVNGELITGNVFTVGSNANYGGMGNLTVEDDANYSRIEVTHNFSMKTLFTKDGRASFYPSYDSVAEAIGLTSDKIVSGNIILGVYGTATEDTDATGDDLLEMKTAYSQGQKIYGTIGDWRGYEIPVSTDSMYTEEDNIRVEIHPEVQSVGYNSLAINNDCGMRVIIPNDEIAGSIGLTSDMVVEGYRVLNIDGTARLGYDTSDADAMAENIEPGYCAYTRDGLVYGSMSVAEGFTIDSEYSKEKPEYRLFYDKEANRVTQIFRNDFKTLVVEGTEMDVRFTGEDIVNAIELTPDQIVAGYTVLGIEGTGKAEITKESLTYFEVDDYVVNLGTLAYGYDAVYFNGQDVGLYGKIISLRIEDGEFYMDISIQHRSTEELELPGFSQGILISVDVSAGNDIYFPESPYIQIEENLERITAPGAETVITIKETATEGHYEMVKNAKTYMIYMDPGMIM